MPERNDTTGRDETADDATHVTQKGEVYSRGDDDRARDASFQPLKKAAESDRSGVGDTAIWFLKPLPIALIAVVVVLIFAAVIL